MASSYTYPNITPTIAPQAGKVYRTRNGTKVGPLVPYTATEGWDRAYAWRDPNDTIENYLNTWMADGRFHEEHGVMTEYDIIAEWTDTEAPPSPVRRRTVTEIVPGTYGRVDVSEYASSAVTHVGVRFEPMSDSYAALNATELRAAASTLTALADALDEIGAQK